jgi:FAD synthase
MMLKISLHHYIRQEKKFESLAALQAQLAKDKLVVKDFMSG